MVIGKSIKFWKRTISRRDTELEKAALADHLRERIALALGDRAPIKSIVAEEDSFCAAMLAIEQALTRLPNAMDEFMNFRYHPEVQDLLKQRNEHH